MAQSGRPARKTNYIVETEEEDEVSDPDNGRSRILKRGVPVCT